MYGNVDRCWNELGNYGFLSYRLFSEMAFLAQVAPDAYPRPWSDVHILLDVTFH